MAKQWSVLSGPSKFDLMNALFNRKSFSGSSVEFKIQEGIGKQSEVRKVAVFLVSQKSDSENQSDPQLWAFSGWMDRGVDHRNYYIGGQDLVIGEYSTQARRGIITQFASNEADNIFDQLRPLKL